MTLQSLLDECAYHGGRVAGGMTDVLAVRIQRSRLFIGPAVQGDPTGLERAFDDRYFMTSSELNLLNTILFVAEWPQPGGAVQSWPRERCPPA